MTLSVVGRTGRWGRPLAGPSTVPSPATRNQVEPIMTVEAGVRSVIRIRSVEGRSRVTAADAIHGFDSSEDSIADGAVHMTFVDPSTPPARRTSARARCDEPTTTTRCARKIELVVTHQPPMPSPATAMGRATAARNASARFRSPLRSRRPAAVARFLTPADSWRPFPRMSADQGGVETLRGVRRGVETLREVRRGVETLREVRRVAVTAPVGRRGVDALRSVRRGVEVADKVYLRLQADAVAIRDLLLHRTDQRHHVGGASPRSGDDEVRVLPRQLGAAHPRALQAERLDHARR